MAQQHTIKQQSEFIRNEVLRPLIDNPAFEDYSEEYEERTKKDDFQQRYNVGFDLVGMIPALYQALEALSKRVTLSELAFSPENIQAQLILDNTKKKATPKG
jgi:hypothetical protein